ncbi:hypothetical protein [Nocardioides sp. R-C-SC26]|uniref:hypothetical protein n=1 Tax=Nocardioides sp. R-C-SC26 TaxID=2870414 RepID=UPI001E31FCCF|nr:hypothetical protein [Nocardioides sp. R-C-SC26]
MEQFSGCVLLLVATTFGLPHIMIRVTERWERGRRAAVLASVRIPDGVHDARCVDQACTYADPQAEFVAPTVSPRGG